MAECFPKNTSGILCFLFYHPEVCCDGVPYIFNGLVKGIALAVASGKGGTMGVIPIFSLIDNYGIFHVFNLPQG